MNILYLTWGENIGFNGLFQEQVVGQLKRIKNLDNSAKFHLLCGIPISRSLIKRNKEYIDFLKRTKDELKIENIDMKWRYIPILSNQFYSKFFILPFYYFGHFNYLKSHLITNKINIVHCRSYHATLFTIIVKKLFKLDIKVLFDTRGLFPEEGVYFKFLQEKGISYKLWKKIEIFLLSNSAATVNVSEIMSEKFKAISSHNNIYTIPTSNNVTTFIESKNTKEINEVKRKYNINKEDKILVHLGVIGNKSWYSLEKLIQIYSKFRNKYVNTKLLIITKANISQLDEYITKYKINSNEIIHLESNSSKETSNYLSVADYAIYTTRLPKGNIDKQILEVLIAAKTGEYLASGLPILVHNDTATLGNLVKRFDLGRVYNDIDDIGALLDEIDNNYKEISNNNVAFAKKYFDNNVNAKKYFELYEKVLNND